MDLGQKIRGARLAAGLSQRQLCGGEITRNMLSQIENGSARPSMGTLSYLAAQLGKPVSSFLEENAVTSPNQPVMEQARAAWSAGDAQQTRRALGDYRAPDPVFDRERQLLDRLAGLALAEAALQEGRHILAGELLEQLGEIVDGYCAGVLNRQRLLLLAKAKPQQRAEICRELPSLDEELLLRARDALNRGSFDRCGYFLGAAEDQTGPEWNFLCGELHLVRQEYDQAAACYHRAEEAYPEKTAVRLEQCYRELEDFKQAYFYACKQKK